MNSIYFENFIKPVTSSFERLDTPSKGFFNVVPQAIYECVFFKPSVVSILMSLMSYVDETGYCSVNQKRLGRNVRIMDEGTVRDMLDVLIETKFINEMGKNGKQHDFKMLDLVNNPYLLLSEAIKYVEAEVMKQGVAVGTIAKVMDKELIGKEDIYLPMIDKIMDCSSTYESYALAVKLVCSRVNEKLGKTFDIVAKAPKKKKVLKKKPSNSDNVIPMTKKKTSGKGSFKKETNNNAPRNREYIPNAANTTGKTVFVEF